MSTVEVDGRFFDSQLVIDALRPQVTAERFRKISEIVANRCKNIVTVTENIYDHGNTCAVMRSAEAHGFHLFHQINELSKYKSAKRVSQGAEKWLVQKRWKDTESCIDHLKSTGYKIYVTHLEGGVPLDQVSFAEPVALCFGSEKLGASRRLTELADAKVFIPMHGFVQSFNISVAAALCFQHARGRVGEAGQLSDQERQQLTALYLYRSCQSDGLVKHLESLTNL